MVRLFLTTSRRGEPADSFYHEETEGQRGPALCPVTDKSRETEAKTAVLFDGVKVETVIR